MTSSFRSFFLLFLCFLFSPLTGLYSQSVQVGSGSYSTTLPPGALGPQNADNQPAEPLISSAFDQPVQTNDFWSSLLFPFFGDPHSAPLFAHPLIMKATSEGLQLGYTPNSIFAGQDYLFPYSQQLTVGVQGLNVSETTVHSYSDWSVTAEWTNSQQTLLATLAHGSPYVFFEVEGGNAVIKTSSPASVWYQNNEVLGVTVEGRHYGIFAPTGSTWNTNGDLTSSLDGKTYLSVALLPDNTTETLDYFRARAYAFVTGTSVSWTYDEHTAELHTSYAYTTELRDSGEGNLDETLSALYRHQWLHLQEAVDDNRTYESPRGTMKLFAGNSFSTSLRFPGILPALPDAGNYNRVQLLAYVQSVAAEPLNSGPTYENGKAMARVANVIHIADQLGAETERDQLLNKLKKRLEDWFTVGGDQEYSYNAQWDVLTGYPSGFGADREINDHHFHSSYAIVSAATIARYDSAWASQDQWGGMVNLLIKDSNNWDRTETQFPFLRSHDIYAGHSWASGHGAFGDGNNQESSSESMNFSSAVVLWGEATGQTNIRDLGIFLYTNEASAINEYWFDVNDQVFPSGYGFGALGIVWGGKGAHGTWFGADPEFIHGINILPLTAGSFYLATQPDYILQNYNRVVAERGSQPITWKDIFWQYLAMSDADQAISYYEGDPNYTPFDGESRAHTYHWLYNFRELGQLDTTVTADIPTYAVFVDGSGDKTYVAYNAGATERVVTFSDGYTMNVGARSLLHSDSEVTSTEGKGNAPEAFILSQNYPNPFNPETTIQYSIPKAGEVRVEVFNTLGQQVELLVETFKPAGSHSVRFNAAGLSSGIYYYRITTNAATLTRKMLLVK